VFVTIVHASGSRFWKILWPITVTCNPDPEKNIVTGICVMVTECRMTAGGKRPFGPDVGHTILELALPLHLVVQVGGHDHALGSLRFPRGMVLRSEA